MRGVWDLRKHQPRRDPEGEREREANPLGSWLAVTDEEGTLVESLHYDPWGNRRQAGDWSHPDHRNSFLFDRGFTGHPHLDPFGIIHMGGRLYDPLTTRFFSPDPFVQLPDNSQSFNRYSYCLNNPLGYVDPTGYLFDDYSINDLGQIKLLRKTEDEFDRLIYVDHSGKESGKQILLPKDNYWDKTILFDLAKTGKENNYEKSFASGGENTQNSMFKVFKFAVDNTNVEWRVDRYYGNSYAIGTVHSRFRAITSEQMGHSTWDVFAFLHSHPRVNPNWELGSMGWNGEGKFIVNSDVGLKTCNDYYQSLFYYTYIPSTGNLWSVRSHQKPAFIRNVTDHTDFFFGVFNTR